MSDFKTYGVCPCGWHIEAPFGSLFHIHRDVCPKCGADKNRWSVITGRVENVGTFFRPKHVLVPRVSE